MSIELVQEKTDDNRVNKLFQELIVTIGKTKDMRTIHILSALANVTGWCIVNLLLKRGKGLADSSFEFFMVELAGAVQKNGVGYRLPWAKFKDGIK